jgi:phage shock protein PspC (stress-responsive transcriptional regulator)
MMTDDLKKCPFCYEEIKKEARKCRWCRSNLEPSASLASWYRDLPGRRFLGVASTLSFNTGIPVIAWRVFFVLLTLFHGLGLFAYFAVWVLTPHNKGGRSPYERLIKAFQNGYTILRHDDLNRKKAQS